jgi:alpha-ketoglutarate-dependent taurine dioxygenase
LSRSVGVEVIGLDMSRPLDEPQRRELAAAFARHHLLVVRGQDISAERQAEFGRIFGTIAIRERNTIPNERADTQHVSNKRADGVFGEGELDFHMDQLFQREPLKALILYGIEIPPAGGDTLFSNALDAYDSLPEPLKRRIDGLQCRHAYSYKGALAQKWNMQQADDNAPTAVHPMAWTDPASGRRAIWVNKLTTVEVLGLDPQEARQLTEEVRKPLYDPAVTYRHQWRPCDLVLWNNRTLQHARTPFDASQARTLRRTPLM